ncbi:MAG: hypothetical protein K0S74_1195 [Chlamydiales bacterium]|nr:hypothetical protein [Chlamydiales bacterium]
MKVSLGNLENGLRCSPIEHFREQGGFEMRSYIADYEEAYKWLMHNASNKGDYKFEDRIYQPKDASQVFDLNNKFTRIRVYSKTNWNQMPVELIHKNRKMHSIAQDAIESFLDILGAEERIKHDYELKLKFSRTGLEFSYENGLVMIFLEKVDGLPPTIEMISKKESLIKEIFQHVGANEILKDSIPELVAKARKL